ncbi:ribonuclease [Mycena rebaudengoi]|nr:ribonuclease [Mycena rebaudengoi]
MFAVTLLAGLFGSSLAYPFSGNSEDLFQRAGISSGCSSTVPESCTNSTAQSDLCCFQAPGGLLLQTQFWDTNPSTGPSDSWTIHGLWPDNCDLTFESSCDPSRAYTGLLTDMLTTQGAADTLTFMKTFWKDINGNDESFWEHEWSKVSAEHRTSQAVFSSITLDVACLPSGSIKGAEAVVYFNTVVQLFKSLPTYQWLSDARITPSSSETHTLASLTSALKTASGGFTPALDCDSTALNQISWYFHLRGSIIDGDFVPITAPETGSCPSSGIKYLPKSGTTKTSATSTATGAPNAIPTKATIHALQNGAQVGGLLSLGTWSTQSLATYTLSGTADSFTLTSSKGSCGVSEGVFACGSGDSSSFSAVSSGKSILLASNGDLNFSSDFVPSGSTVSAVNVGANSKEVYTLSIISA